jgi:hypothetical protein
MRVFPGVWVWGSAIVDMKAPGAGGGMSATGNYSAAGLRICWVHLACKEEASTTKDTKGHEGSTALRLFWVLLLRGREAPGTAGKMPALLLRRCGCKRAIR